MVAAANKGKLFLKHDAAIYQLLSVGINAE